VPSELNLTEYVAPGIIEGLFIGDPEPGPTPLQALGVQLVTVWGTVESLVQTTVCPRWIVRSAGWNSNSQLPGHETMDTPTWAGRVVVVVGGGLVVGVVVGGGLDVGGDDALVVGGDDALVAGGPVGTVVVGCVSEVTGDVVAVVVADARGGFEVDLLEPLCVPVWCSPAVFGPL
jgi:hypothetical protein